MLILKSSDSSGYTAKLSMEMRNNLIKNKETEDLLDVSTSINLIEETYLTDISFLFLRNVTAAKRALLKLTFQA